MRKSVEHHDPDLLRALRTLVQSPLSIRKIADRLGVSTYTVRDMIKRNGIEYAPIAIRQVQAMTRRERYRI